MMDTLHVWTVTWVKRPGAEFKYQWSYTSNLTYRNGIDWDKSK